MNHAPSLLLFAGEEEHVKVFVEAGLPAYVTPLESRFRFYMKVADVNPRRKRRTVAHVKSKPVVRLPFDGSALITLYCFNLHASSLAISA